MGHHSGRWKVSCLHLRLQWEHGFPGGLQLLLPLLFHSRSNRQLNTWNVLVNQVRLPPGSLGPNEGVVCTTLNQVKFLCRWYTQLTLPLPLLASENELCPRSLDRGVQPEEALPLPEEAHCQPRPGRLPLRALRRVHGDRDRRALGLGSNRKSVASA